MNEAAKAVEFDIWALHADHISIKTGDPAEIEGTKQLIDAQIAAGYTSFAIDASHLFNFEGKNVREELEKNIRATTDLARHIKNRMKARNSVLKWKSGRSAGKTVRGLSLQDLKKRLNLSKP